MKTYIVTWEIDIDANSPRAAAKKARKIMLDKDSLATVFEVQEVDKNDAPLVTLDLSDHK
jgi:hypothetical protein